MFAETRASQPDILEVIADLSNDEVFTPPEVANAVLDLLPDHVWSDRTLRWLDPGCKTGVFLREITRRLMRGLEEQIRDDDERLEHILRNQVCGVAVTELTALMSRRTVYCSKTADGEHSTVKFETSSGNIWFERVEHTFVKGRCVECAAPEGRFGRDGRDNHAYALLHAAGRHTLRQEMEMRFDVIVGNPPYQMTGGAGGTNDSPLYNLFVEQAKALNPRYITMITPSRWMAGGRSLGDFRRTMLNDNRVRVLVDYENAKDLFPAVGINGGISYFLWDRDNPGPCTCTYHRNGQVVGPVERDLGEFDVLVRDPRALSIVRKVKPAVEHSFAEMLTGDTPFGLATNFTGYAKDADPGEGEVRVYANVGTTRVRGAMPAAQVVKNTHLVDSWKVLVPKAGSGRERETSGVDMVLGPPLVAEPGSVCTQTYICAAPLSSRAEADSVRSYLRTRFFRFLVSLRKISQDALRGVYEWVPQQTWDREWVDAELYEKYGITDAEQAYIAELIREMPA